MSLFNRLLGRGNQQEAAEDENFPGYTPTNINQEHGRGKHESQFMQSGRTGYQGEEVLRTYEIPASVEQQGLTQTEVVNTPHDVQQQGLRGQHLGGEPVQVFDGTETRGGIIHEPLHAQTLGERGDSVLRHEGRATETEPTYTEQPKSPRSPRKEGITSKVKKMFGAGGNKERDHDEYATAEAVGEDDIGSTATRSTRDDSTASRLSPTKPAHSTSAGGLSPRGDWHPTEGFNFRRGNTPPPHLSRREEKAAAAVAKQDGGYPSSGYDNPQEERASYEGGGYDKYGDDSVPVTFDVPHSKPGRYASGEHGGSWGDHRASEVGSFRGAGMHSPSKDRPTGNTEKPYWTAPGAKHDPSVAAAAAAAGGAAAAKAATSGEATRREEGLMGRNQGPYRGLEGGLEGGSSERTHGLDRGSSERAHGLDRGSSENSHGLGGGVSERTPGLDRGLSGNSRGVVGDFSERTHGLDRGLSQNSRGVESGLSDRTPGLDRGLSENSCGIGGNFSERTPGLDRGLSQNSRGVGSGLSEGTSGLDRGLSQNSRGMGGDVFERTPGLDRGLSQNSRGVGSGLSERTHGLDQGLTDGRQGVGEGLTGKTHGTDGVVAEGTHGLHHGDVYDPWQDSRFRESRKHLTSSETSGSYASAQDRDGSLYGRSDGAARYFPEQHTMNSPRSNSMDQPTQGNLHSAARFSSGQELPTAQPGMLSASGSGVTNRAEPVSDIRDYYQSGVAQPGVERSGELLDSEGRNLEKGAFGSGQDISPEGYDNQEQYIEGYGNNQRFDNMNLNNVQGRNDQGVRSSNLSQDVGQHIGGQELGSGFVNQGLAGNEVNNQGYNQGSGSLGTKRATTEGYGNQEYAGKDFDNQGYDQGLNNRGTTGGYGSQEFGDRTPNQGYRNQDLDNLGTQHSVAQGHGSQDFVDTQTGARNFGVGGRTEAHTPYQLGERIADEKSDVRGYERTGIQLPSKEQSFGVGGATKAATPYDLGEKISDKSWNNEGKTGAQNFGVGGRTEADTPYQLEERMADEKSNVRRYERTDVQSPAREQSFGVGGATKAATPYGLGEKISDKSWNDGSKPGMNTAGLEAGALGAGALGVGVGAFEANRMRSGDHHEFNRSTSTGKPLLNQEDEIALAEGKAAETPAAAAAATQHATTEQSDLHNPYVKEGVVIGGASTVPQPPLSPTSQQQYQYVQHGEPVKSPGILSTAKYALGRAQDKLTNTHHHLTAGGSNISSVTGVAFGKLDVVAKRMLKGGEYLWREAFHPSPDEHLRKSFACLLSTENGAVAGVLYQSDHNLWFCSDRALQRAVKTEADVATPPAHQQYLYKVVLPLAEVRSIESSASGRSERDKSIKVEMSGSEQFWFFGFVTFDKALLNLQHAGEVHKLRSASMKMGGA